MLNELRVRIDELSENLHNNIKNLEKNQSEMKNIITVMRNTLQGINKKLYEAED